MFGTEQAIHFPEHADVPETKRHLRLRTLVWQFLDLAFSGVAAIGCDQFVYWDPTDPRRCLAPDAFVRFGAPDDDFRTWKVWERGAPHVALEIISDADELSWELKFERYREMGVSELVWFDPERPEQPLRIWDFVGDELLERRLLEPWAQSRHLGGYWLPVEVPGEGFTLRLSHDPHGLRLFPTAQEAERSQKEVERSQKEVERSQKEAERSQKEAETRRADNAERELRELKALLQNKS